jgi:hypothetical protein
MKEEDKSFIFSSWLRSYRNSHFASPLCNAVYFEHHKKIVEQLLNNAEVVILCAKNDEDHIYSFICYSHLSPKLSTIHFIYTKYPYRKMGIAQHLYNLAVGGTSGATICITHYSAHLKQKITDLNIIYNPYLLF